MTTKLAKSASNNGQIIKSWLPNDRRAKFLPSVAEIAYDLLRIEGYLGNVGLNNDTCRKGVVFHGQYDLVPLERRA
jgi:hypothetical protein